jgi:hypothetical protein
VDGTKYREKRLPPSLKKNEFLNWKQSHFSLATRKCDLST